MLRSTTLEFATHSAELMYQRGMKIESNSRFLFGDSLAMSTTGASRQHGGPSVPRIVSMMVPCNANGLKLSRPSKVPKLNQQSKVPTRVPKRP